MVARLKSTSAFTLALFISLLWFSFPIPVFAVNYNVTIVSESSPNAAGAGIRIDGVLYRNNDVVSLSAGSHTCVAFTPTGWSWLYWFETTNARVDNPNSSSTILTVSGNGVLGAGWGPIVTFYAFPSEGGTVSVDYWGAPKPYTKSYSNGQSGVIDGYSSNLRAIPSSRYAFSNWSTSGSMNVASLDSSTTLWTPTGPGSVTVNFVDTQPQQNCSISLKSNGTDGTYNKGSITFAGIQLDLPANISRATESYAITGNPPSGYVFQRWQAQEGVAVTDPYVQTTTATVSGNGSIEAIWYPFDRYPILVETVAGEQKNVGSITVSGTTQIPGAISWVGSSLLPISGNPPSGFQFNHWEFSESVTVTNPNSQSTTISATGAGNLTAWFTASSRQLSVKIEGNPAKINTNEFSAITTSVSSDGSLLSGVTVSLDISGGELSKSSGTTGSEGQWTVSFSSTISGQFTVTASASKSGYISGSANTQITVASPTPPVTPSPISSTPPATLPIGPADGSAYDFSMLVFALISAVAGLLSVVVAVVGLRKFERKRKERKK